MRAEHDVMRWVIPTQKASASKSDAATPYMMEEFEDTIAAMRSVIDAMRRCAKLIDYLAFLIRISQFKDRNGMFDIRWWSGSGRVSPVLVRWTKTAKGTSRPIAVQRLRDDSLKFLCAPTVEPILKNELELARRAIDLWMILRKGLFNVSQVRGFLGRIRFEERFERLAEESLAQHIHLQRELDLLGVKLSRNMRIESVLANVPAELE
jgi:hypothetical protein